jgi:hypothetical protein
MVDEREDRYEGEEGEYHFSDDQVNYEEVEAPKAAQTTVSMKKTIFDKFSGLSGSRRMLLAGVVFVSLIGIVYKMLLPSSPVVTGEISQVPIVKQATPQQIATTKPATPATPPTSPPVQTAPVIQPPPPVMNPPPPPQTMMASPSPQNAAAPQPGLPNPAETAQGMPPQTMYPTTPAAPAAPITQTAAMPPISSPQASIPPNVVDRVKAVEDHNAAIMNLLQTEYAQKMSEFEMQSNLVRGKMDEMAKRVNRIESSLNQITQLLQQSAPRASKSQTASMESVPALPTRSAVPRVTYTVQAIIPGRAWLKGDSGDTVTVAEGDTLRDYGRITKIDPYDGVVEIDTGNKIIALSYGMSGE